MKDTRQIKREHFKEFIGILEKSKTRDAYEQGENIFECYQKGIVFNYSGIRELISNLKNQGFDDCLPPEIRDNKYWRR